MDIASPTPTIGKLHIDAPAAPGIDPTTAALMSGGRGGLLGGNGNDGGLLLLLLLSMFNRNGGLFGGAGGGDAVAAQSIMTPKDVSQQITTFQSWASNNASQLLQAISGVDKSLCASTGQIISAVNSLTPQMYQQFQALSSQECNHFAQTNENLSDGLNGIEKSLDVGFAATQMQFQTTAAASQLEAAKNASAILVNVDKQAAAINLAVTQGNYALAQQLAQCCCENRLAICQQNALIERTTAATQAQAAANYASISNQLSSQTCEIKQAIAADGQATRALIQANAIAELQAQLNDAKAALSNQQQSAAIIAALKPHPVCV